MYTHVRIISTSSSSFPLPFIDDICPSFSSRISSSMILCISLLARISSCRRGLRAGSLLSLMKWNLSMLEAALRMSWIWRVRRFYYLAIYPQTPERSWTKSSAARVSTTRAYLLMRVYSSWSSWQIYLMRFMGNYMNFPTQLSTIVDLLLS